MPLQLETGKIARSDGNTLFKTPLAPRLDENDMFRVPSWVVCIYPLGNLVAIYSFIAIAIPVNAPIPSG